MSEQQQQQRVSERLKRRSSFRDQVFRSSSEQRRIAKHTLGMTRPLAETLCDRQCRGPRGIFRPATQADFLLENRSKSPSTVCDTASEPAAATPSNAANCTKTTLEFSAVADATNTTPSSSASAEPPIPQPQNTEKASHQESSAKKLKVKNAAHQNGPCSVHDELLYYVEYVSSIQYQSAFLHHLGGDDGSNERGERPVSSRAVSTISIAFSSDSQTMASTHGDHTVKISSCVTGRLLRSLEGHPRTPWTVKYHPVDSNIVASGCLGHQVRVWNWPEATCLQMVRLEFAIISLTFHPSGRCLAVANGTRLHFWGVGKVGGSGNANNRSAPNSGNSSSSAAQQQSNSLSEMDQRHMLRCVHFPPDGRSLIIGGVNPTTEDPRRRSRPGIGGGGGMSFYLRLWEFHLDVALSPPSSIPNISSISSGDQAMAVRPISNPRTFVPRALLYNDGGFDVSPDGKVLCACVELWLPDGCNNAMELLHREEDLFEQKNRASESTNFGNQGSSENTGPSIAGIDTTAGAGPTKTDAPAGSSVTSANATTSAPAAAATPTFSQRSTSSSYSEAAPRTPEPSANTAVMRLTPPPPPGRRLIPSSNMGSSQNSSGPQSNPAEGSPPPLPPGSTTNQRPPHPLSAVTSTSYPPETRRGRYVPHVVTISLDTSPLSESILQRVGRNPAAEKSNNKNHFPLPAVAVGYKPRLGQLLEACPLDEGKASAVTCVKFSPSTNFCLIGYGVREADGGQFHPVTAIYRVRSQMAQISTMLSREDDVNIARFHPSPGHGFVYGTKQGRVRVVSTRPWMIYNEQDEDEEEDERYG